MPLQSMTSSKRAKSTLGFLLPCSHCATALAPTPIMSGQLGGHINSLVAREQYVLPEMAE